MVIDLVNQIDELEQVEGSDVIRLTVPAVQKYLNVVGACLSAMLQRVERITERESLTYNVELAVHETCTNIVEHAYGDDRNGRIDVVFSLAERPRRLVVDLHDTGQTFLDISQLEEIDLEKANISGYGLFLIYQLLDEVTYQPQSGNNRWRLVKYLS